MTAEPDPDSGLHRLLMVGQADGTEEAELAAHGQVWTMPLDALDEHTTCPVCGVHVFA